MLSKLNAALFFKDPACFKRDCVYKYYIEALWTQHRFKIYLLNQNLIEYARSSSKGGG